jgi:hypothetical protein
LQSRRWDQRTDLGCGINSCHLAHRHDADSKLAADEPKWDDVGFVLDRKETFNTISFP